MNEEYITRLLELMKDLQDSARAFQKVGTAEETNVSVTKELLVSKINYLSGFVEALESDPRRRVL